jgi:uncharacterized protein YndB with AHSA1/START domain
MAEDTYTVERSTTIAAPAGRVYEQLADFHKWVNWSPWEDLDPALERTYSGAEAGTGAVYEWSGNRKAGTGRMEIVRTVEAERVDIDLQFIKPFKARNDTSFVLTQQGEGSTDVLWTMTGQKSLMTKVMGIFSSMDKMIGPDFEKGLDRLKRVSETGS